ncbi:MAG: vitamin B12-dependent ribonucleotide reductase [Nitrospirae bacterium]|uniref:vitamin B12-dependent ribonucleotide reductase n=1 Tax=Candidatus Magnetobacterium casense TaxID=1455061 RepID=UPI00058B541C|nr:vitamin B12-dependent ribonucleotide reductase [Candidatus Magnetobacterium casensis]MBF0338102.1 vitamin B12-dependent ribonucleotide reductase [Nitrospirota bacterium]
MNLTPNAIKVLEKRYLKKDDAGVPIETPQDLFKRIARFVASADLNYGKGVPEIESLEGEFYELMTSLSFLPNSPTLMNAGRRLGQLSACFVLPVEDSMESIFEAVKNAALIHKSGGGTGFSFSSLRPKGDMVGSTKGVSSGPVSFMTVFDTATEAVKQGGTRRGANMAIVRVDHPDILDFTTCKDNKERLNNFNISVAITEQFMTALEAGAQYDLINPRNGNVVKKLDATHVFDTIVKHAWKNGEPGIVFLDRLNQANPTPLVGEIEATNPCGEQPLLPYESCNLGSINLAKMVRPASNGGRTTFEIDYQRLKQTTHKAVHFLDNVIDLNKYPLKSIEEMTRANRKIGLGVMGWADMLIQLGIPYSSEQAIELAEEVIKTIHQEGRDASEALAQQRGVFPNHKGSIYDGSRKMRNATITTIAPTGTLSIIAGCSSGIEPIFAVCYVRNVLEGTKLIEVNPYFEAIAKQQGFYSEKLMQQIAGNASISAINDIPGEVRETFVTAHDITPQYHVRMQAAFQKYVDNAVSKTVNFPAGATVDDVKQVYLQAYRSGCKGVTVYRDGSRDEQVLSTQKVAAPVEVKAAKVTPRKRPKTIKGSTEAMLTGCGNLYVTVNLDEKGVPFEVFNHIGKAGGCAASQSEAIGRLVSLALRCNIVIDEIIKQLKGISCHQPIWTNGGKISSCSDAIAKAIEHYNGQGQDAHNGNGDKYTENMLVGACPECGGCVEHEGGCSVCHDCGFTKCE